MNYGLYLSASGVLTNTYRQDVYANNLANVNTVAFKRDLPMIHQRSPEVVEEQFGGDVANRLLDRLGGGVYAGPQRISFAPASLQQTHGDLDLALASADTFFNVAVTDPTTGQTQTRLTRDGRMLRDAEGYLVTASGGHRLLDDRNTPIQTPEGVPLAINGDGDIRAGDNDIATLGVAHVADTDRLIKKGGGLYAWRGQGDPRTAATDPQVRQGFIESSGVDPIQTLMDLIASTKATTTNGNLIRYHDLMMDRAVNSLGRVA
jgi:flagellar basal body rod protein FlgG